MVAAEARPRVAVQEAARTSPGSHDSLHERRQQDEQHSWMQRIQNFQPRVPEKLIEGDDPRHAIQENGGLADQWYLDGGDILCHPILVLPYLQAFDTANDEIGAERNPQKPEVIHYVTDLEAAPVEWQINDLGPLASVSSAAREISHSELQWDPACVSQTSFWRKQM